MKCDFQYINGCMTCSRCEFKICGKKINVQNECSGKSPEEPKQEIKDKKIPPKLDRLERIKNTAKDLTAAAKDVIQLNFAEENEAARRLKICGDCEHYTGTICKLCGCHMKTKCKLASSKCPADKW